MPTPETACLLSHRGVLRLGGDDRRAFLQGLISNDIALCTPEKSLYAALLTPQGKFLHDMFIYDAGDFLLIDCEAARADDLLQRLMAYKLRAKISIENVSERFDVVALSNAPASQNNQHLICTDPRLPALGSRGIVEKNKNDFPISDAVIYDQYRLSLGIAEGSRDLIIGKSTLSEGNFDLLNGISWTKGCYVGQELTARMHHRALVKKRMFPVKFSGTTPTFGAPIYDNDTEVGEMRSSDGDIGVALLNIEHTKAAITNNTPLIAETAKLMPYPLEWLKI